MSARKRGIWLVTSGLLQTLFGSLRRRVGPGHIPDNEESARKPQIVDEGPTKHWTTIVVTMTEVSAECRCGWVEVVEGRRVELASAAARQHRNEAIPDVL